LIDETLSRLTRSATVLDQAVFGRKPPIAGKVPMLESRPMMRPGCAVTTAALLGAAAGCSSSREPPPSLSVVLPAAAYSDQAFTMTIETGGSFRAAYRIDTGSGSGANDSGGFSLFLDPSPGDAANVDAVRVPAVAVSWQNANALTAALPAGVTAGRYDVVVVDPRGARTTAPRAFLSLGTDLDPPMVSIDDPSPGILLGAGTQASVTFSANDGLGHLAALTWSATVVGASSPVATDVCAPPGGAASASCMFSFPIPTTVAAGDQLTIEVVAEDSQGNRGVATLLAELAPRPVVTSFGPTAGPAIGGTSLAVTGMNFLPGVTQIFVGDVPLDTDMATSTIITAFTLAHDPGPVPITVRSATASADAGTFLFVAVPSVREVIPARGASAGGTPVSIIGNYFRAGVTALGFVSDDGTKADLRCPTFRGPSRVDGYAPAGTGVVAVAAGDPIAGGTELEQAFTYDDTLPPGLAPDAGCPEAGTTP
jgi:hypothetical protein